MECWGRKREGPRLFARARHERGYFWEELDDFLGGWLGGTHYGGVGLGLLVLLAIVGFVVVLVR